MDSNALKPEDITCQGPDFLKACEALQKSSDPQDQRLSVAERTIVTQVINFAHKFKIALNSDRFSEELLDAMSKSEVTDHQEVAKKVRTILADTIKSQHSHMFQNLKDLKQYLLPWKTNLDNFLIEFDRHAASIGGDFRNPAYNPAGGRRQPGEANLPRYRSGATTGEDLRTTKKSMDDCEKELNHMIRYYEQLPENIEYLLSYKKDYLEFVASVRELYQQTATTLNFQLRFGPANRAEFTPPTGFFGYPGTTFLDTRNIQAMPNLENDFWENLLDLEKR